MANSPNTPPQSLERLSASFTRFAELECRGMSPLYETLSLGIAADDDLLALASRAKPGQPRPNLFMAAVQRLLMEEHDHPLAVFYPHISGRPLATGDPVPAFRDFCLELQGELTALLTSRMVQTNVVRRCASMMPAFAYVDGLDLGGSPYLIEIGASAGLNLFWDKYGYDYGNGGVYGDARSPVQISSTFRGGLRPEIPEAMPVVAGRVGIDLNPIDLADREETTWLKALVWPERRDELELLEAAMQATFKEPPQMIQGDALDLLPGLIDSVPADQVPCLFHSHVLNQFPREAREVFWDLVELHGARRNLAVVSKEGVRGGEHSAVEVNHFRDGVQNHQRLANDDSHGYWLEWLVG